MLVQQRYALETGQIAILNYLAIILVMNLIGFCYFYFSPARKAPELKPSVHSFMTMFACIAIAFIVFASRQFIPDWISLTFANALFLLSSYYARRGFLYRSKGTSSSNREKQVIWTNVIALTIINTGVFYFYFENFAVRATLTSVNVSIVFCSCLSVIPKDPKHLSNGERIAKYAVLTTALLTPAAAILFWFEDSFFAYMSTLMFTQAIAVTTLIGAFLNLIMSDVIDDHYQNSVTDPLTKLYNRRFVIDKASKVLGFAQTTRDVHAIIIVDIDDFKKINDEHGHDVGDEALVNFAKILSKRVRGSDILARLGGEEFVILMPNSSLKDAKALAERLCEEVANSSFSATHGQLNFTASFGVSMLSNADELEESLKHADLAMYQAKEAGKNQVIVFESV